jgi:hypothetical protein
MRTIIQRLLRLTLLLILLAGSALVSSGPTIPKCKAQTCCENCQESPDACVNNGTSWTVCLALYNRCASGCGGCESGRARHRIALSIKAG